MVEQVAADVTTKLEKPHLRNRVPSTCVAGTSSPLRSAPGTTGTTSIPVRCRSTPWPTPGGRGGGGHLWTIASTYSGWVDAEAIDGLTQGTGRRGAQPHDGADADRLALGAHRHSI